MLYAGVLGRNFISTIQMICSNCSALDMPVEMVILTLKWNYVSRGRELHWCSPPLLSCQGSTLEQRGMEKFRPSVIPLHEGFGLGTYSPLLESLSLIIPSKSSHNVLPATNPCFLPLFYLCGTYSLSLPLFVYISVTSSLLCLRLFLLFISVCLRMLATVAFLLHSLLLRPLSSLLCLKARRTSRGSHHSRAPERERWPSRPHMLPSFKGMSEQLLSTLLAAFWLVLISLARTAPEICRRLFDSSLSTFRSCC